MLFTWLRRRRRAALLAEPFPPAWLDALRANVPLYARLPPADQARLRDDLRVFVADKSFEGCGGFALTDEVRVTIAAHACLLLLGVRHDDFERVKSILVYPSAVVPDAGVTGADGVVHHGVPLAGQAWGDGPVVLAWDEVLAGARDDRDGRNVVLHEFAHQLDFLDGEADGVPNLPGDRYADWRRVTTAAFEALEADVETGRRTLLDAYGATNRAEFFAVATECFFERPVGMRETAPELYRVLVGYYGQDPANGRGGGRLKPFRGSRTDIEPRVRRLDDWPGWVTFWEIYPGVPRSFPTGYINNQLSYGVGFLLAVGLSFAIPGWRAVAGRIVLLMFSTALLGAAGWMYAAVRWVDRRNGWAGEQPG